MKIRQSRERIIEPVMEAYDRNLKFSFIYSSTVVLLKYGVNKSRDLPTFETRFQLRKVILS